MEDAVRETPAVTELADLVTKCPECWEQCGYSEFICEKNSIVIDAYCMGCGIHFRQRLHIVAMKYEDVERVAGGKEEAALWDSTGEHDKWVNDSFFCDAPEDDG